jgi:CheY-like chemotaxis protein
MNASLQSPPMVLYVENNSDDLFFLERQAKRSSVCFKLHGVSDVSSALAFIQRCNSHLPGAVLLDYTLDHGTTGLDFVRFIRREAAYKNLVVIMYSSGELPEIIASCYNEGAQYFVQKSSNIERIREFVQCLDLCLSYHPHSFEPLRRLKEYARPWINPPGTCDSLTVGS